MPPSSTSDPAPEKIALVVDDVPSVRFYHSYILKRVGFRCEAAADGEDALRRLETLRPDLAVVDVMMPKLNGLDLVRRIRSRPEFARLPILIISSEPVCAEVASLAGPVGFVKKPLSPDPVIQEVNRLLRRSP